MPDPIAILDEAAEDAPPVLRAVAAFFAVPDVAVELDQDRIAAELQDHVVSELFATGMGLEAVAEGLSRGDQLRVLGYVESLDATIFRLRSTIVQLEQRDHALGSLRQRVLRAFDDATAMTGLHATIELSGVCGSGIWGQAIPADIACDLIAAVRGALLNATGHPAASTVSVQVALSESCLRVNVTDDGHPALGAASFGGLLELSERAHRHGGTLELEPAGCGGSRLRWEVAFSAAD